VVVVVKDTGSSDSGKHAMVNCSCGSGVFVIHSCLIYIVFGDLASCRQILKTRVLMQS